MSDVKPMNVTQNQAYFQHPLIPFLLVFGGVISDFLTTTVGLSMGFYEAHPQYHPILALAIFFTIITVLTVLLPRQKPGRLATIGVALLSYIGALNNTLVILRF